MFILFHSNVKSSTHLIDSPACLAVKCAPFFDGIGCARQTILRVRRQPTIGLGGSPITCEGGACQPRQFTLSAKGKRSTVLLERCRSEWLRCAGIKLEHTQMPCSTGFVTATRTRHTYTCNPREPGLACDSVGIPDVRVDVCVCACGGALSVYWYAERCSAHEWGDSAPDFVYYWGAQHVGTWRNTWVRCAHTTTVQPSKRSTWAMNYRRCYPLHIVAFHNSVGGRLLAFWSFYSVRMQIACKSYRNAIFFITNLL